VLAVREHLDLFADAEIVIVTFADPARLAAQRAYLDVPFTYVSDVDRRFYGLLGAERGSRRRVWSLGTLRMYARLVRSGRRLTRPTDDVYQLGADAVVDRDGHLRYLSLPASPDARPPVAELITAVRACAPRP
jgi:hypothetical protein